MPRYYTDVGQRARVRVDDEAVEDVLAARLTKATLQLSNSATSQLVLGTPDPRLRLLRADCLDKGTEVRFGDLRLVVAVRELTLEGSVPLLQVTARARGVQKMRRTSGARVWRGMSPTQWVHLVARDADLEVVAEPSHSRAMIRRAGPKKGQPGETDWDVFARLATELGFIAYESEQTLYFGRPTWLAKQFDRIEVTWRVDSDPTPGGLLGVPTVRDSDDDTTHGFTGTLVVTAEAAERFTPSKAVQLGGVGPYDGVYLITDTSLTLDGASPATVSIATPVNPEPQPAGGTGAGGVSAGGGSKKLRDLLAEVGFKGAHLNEAVGIVVAESGADAHAIGDTHLVDAKWGPSVGIFQIRSLRNPSAFSGNDALRIKSRLRDAHYNARVAFKISRGGADWSAWSTWNDGSWRAHASDNPTITNWAGLPVVGGGGGAGGPAVWPTPSKSISTRWHQPGDVWAIGYHTGVDIDGECGDPIWSATAGKVVQSGWNGSYGFSATIRTDGHDLMYCHMTSHPKVRVGQQVAPKTPLGNMGDTGNSYGCHLHFEVRPAGASYGSDVNPLNWLP